MKYTCFYVLAMLSCSLVQSAQDLYDFMVEQDVAAFEARQADVVMHDSSAAAAADLQNRNSSGYTGEVLTKFQYWPQLPIDIKRKIMDRARANSALRVTVPVVCRMLLNAVSSVVLKGNKVVSGSDDGLVRAWDLETGEFKVLWGDGGPVNSVAIEGSRVVSGSDDGTVQLWDLETGEQLRALEGHVRPVNSVALKGNRVVSGSGDRTVRVWDLETGEPLKRLRGHRGPVYSVALEGNRVVSGSWDRTVGVWDLGSDEPLQIVQECDGMVTAVALEGNRVVSGSDDGTVRLWDLETGEIKVLWGHVGPVNSVAIEGSRVVSGSDDGTVRLWDLETGEQLRALEGHVGPVNSVALKRNRVVSGSQDKTIQVWDLTVCNAVYDWFKEDCKSIRETVSFENSCGETCSVSADPIEMYMLLVEYSAALQRNKKITLSRKQQAYFDILPQEVRTAFEKDITSQGRCSIM